MKKIISLLLVVCMLAACCTAFAAEMTTENKADALYLLGVFQGTDKGYELESKTTREQGVTMLVRVLGMEEEANSGKYECKFTDVYDWAKGYVGYAYDKNITKGISDTLFGYGNELTDAMFLTMLLRILGYAEGTADTDDFVWDAPYALAKELGLIEKDEATAEFVRGNMVDIIYNVLGVKYKGTETTVADQLTKDGVFTKETYDLSQKVADGTTTLEEAKAALNPEVTPGGSEGGSVVPEAGMGGTPGGTINGGTAGGSNGGNTGGSNGGTTTPEEPRNNHETPDIDL